MTIFDWILAAVWALNIYFWYLEYNSIHRRYGKNFADMIVPSNISMFFFWGIPLLISFRLWG